MDSRRRIGWSTAHLVFVLLFAPACGTAYETVVRPVNDLKGLAPEMADFTDDAVETYLKANVRPSFPAVLAVAKLSREKYRHYDRPSDAAYELESVVGAEAAGWRRLADEPPDGKGRVIKQVQFVSPMLAGTSPDLKRLRHAAAQLHATMLLVYVQDESSDEGYNDAAMAYWTIIGLFLVPGNTVGHYTTCQALLLDTQTGLILATADGESKKEENVLPGAVPIAARRTEQTSRSEAAEQLQTHVLSVLGDLAATVVAGGG